MTADEKTSYLLQWFHPLLNIPAYEEMFTPVHKASNLQIRRNNHRIGNQFSDISSKLEIARFHGRSAVARISFARSKTKKMMADFEKDFRSGPQRDVVSSIEFRDYELVAHVEGVLIQSKCLLDSLAQLYSISFDRSIKTFSKSGKNFISDLKYLSETNKLESIALQDLVESAKGEWIDEAIAYRDELVHFGQLRKFRCLHFPVDPGSVHRFHDVLDSVMPNGEATATYIVALLKSMHEFSAKWVAIMFRRLEDREKALRNYPVVSLPR